MADKKISQLTASTTPLAGTEVLPIVQSGATVKVAVSDLTAGRAVSAASLALTSSALPVGSGGTGTATAFTTGSVVFAGASGVYSQDNAVLFYDNTNDRLGVGTATPSYRLDVTRNGGGGDNAQIARITDSSTANSLGPLHLTVGATNHFAGNPGMVLAGTNGIGLAVGDGSDLAGQRKLTIDSSSNVTVNSGNLVIGTSGKGITDSTGGTTALFTSTEVTVNKPVISTRFTSVSGSTASTASGTPVTIFAVPVTVGNYLVSASVGATDDPTNYNPVSILRVNRNASVLTSLAGTATMTITLSGSNVQATQNIGSSQVIQFAITRIF